MPAVGNIKSLFESTGQAVETGQYSGCDQNTAWLYKRQSSLLRSGLPPSCPEAWNPKEGGVLFLTLLLQTPGAPTHKCGCHEGGPAGKWQERTAKGARTEETPAGEEPAVGQPRPPPPTPARRAASAQPSTLPDRDAAAGRALRTRDWQRCDPARHH